MKKLTLIILSLISLNSVHAESLNNNINLDDLILKADDAQESILSKKFTINKRFASIEQVAKSVTLTTKLPHKIINQSADKVSSVNIVQTEGTVASFLDNACNKFNYSWKLSDASIVFTANNPFKAVQRSEVKATQASTDNNWIIDVNDKRISVLLTRWAKQAGYQLVWDSKTDFEIRAGGNISGSFRAALNEVLKSLEDSSDPLKANWYKNNVIVITPIGNK